MDLRFWYNNRKERSFTLIELLVVIAIIGLLSSVVLVSMQGTRQKAKIAKAQQEVSAIYKAISLKEAKEEEYPHTNNMNSISELKHI